VYGDFSRVFDNRYGQYSGVLAQQGRFLLDAELNEQNAIVLDYLRRLTTDLLGPFAAPRHRAGFEVTPIPDASGEKCAAVELGPGHYYVYGLRCEAPRPDDEPTQIGHTRAAPFVVYLVVWEQAISAIQAPELLDPALGFDTPDTTRRRQVRWRPQLATHLPGSDVDLTELDRERIIDHFHHHNADPERLPRMAARARVTTDPEEAPTASPVAAAYRGVENQLYRIEIHAPGSGKEATFKWSRDNGSVEFGLADLTGDGDPYTATLTSLGRDPRTGLQEQDWVELVDDRWAPVGDPPPLMKVEKVTAASRQVTLAATDEQPLVFDASLHPLLRRWDQRPEDPAAGQGIPVSDASGRWYELEDGIQIQFDPAAGHYARGDFWLVPARTATRGVLWPDADGQPLAVAPQGPARYLAPLALVRSLDEVPAVDLRTRFGPRMHEREEVGDEPARLDIADATSQTTISPPILRFRLRSISKFAKGAASNVSDGAITIGRGPGEGIQLEQSDVSRHHAMLRVDGERLTIEDADSRNGTFVNGDRIHEPVELQLGDVIAFGSEDVQLEVEPPGGSES